MKKILSICIAASMLAACNPRGEYRIHGYTTENDLNGIQIFLVPLHDQSTAMVDSVVIRDNKFEFKGHGKMRQEWMAELRIARSHRMGHQNLLVVTEPGDIYVTIGKESSGYGTPQNDSLQVWKEMTMGVNATTSNLYNMGRKAEADSIRAIYRERSRQLCENIGPETTLGAFLGKMFPPKKKD